METVFKMVDIAPCVVFEAHRNFHLFRYRCETKNSTMQTVLQKLIKDTSVTSKAQSPGKDKENLHFYHTF